MGRAVVRFSSDLLEKMDVQVEIPWPPGTLFVGSKVEAGMGYEEWLIESPGIPDDASYVIPAFRRKDGVVVFDSWQPV